MWEALGAIPPSMEAEFHDEIKKRIKIQEQYLKDRMIRREKIAIKCYIMSFPLDGFHFYCIIVDEAQSLRNIESGSSRIITRVCLPQKHRPGPEDHFFELGPAQTFDAVG
ncbi:hypothetical protein MFIFM68171_10949 [Madurella fahalii]|uniref:SNF2 N-terminal domain-containing protein n=1 Tax=Madurella fahalii TaxID=1157608 RepID=A0ABQ0GSQ0_9PEZI